jgi:hypothetical protein
MLKTIRVVAVAALSVIGLAAGPAAVAQGPATPLGRVVERDSSTWIHVAGAPCRLFKGQQSQPIPVAGCRLSWKNSQGCQEWTTLPVGVRWVIVRRAADASREVDFFAYR